MKVYLKHFTVFLLLTIMFSFVACNDTDDGSFVEPITIYEKIRGNWKTTFVKQIDEVAKSKSESPSEMTITDLFNFSTFSIALNVDANNKPTEYKVGGTAPELFPKSGYWNLDYEFPNTNGTATKLNLYSDAAKTNKVGELSITATPGATSVLELKFTRKTQGTDFVSYVYNLSPYLTSNE